MPSIVDLRRYPSLAGDVATDSPLPYASIRKEGDGFAIHHDWLGQMPIHVRRRGDRLYVANTIKDLLWTPGYAYEECHVLRHGASLHVPAAGDPVQKTEVDLYAYCPPDFEEKKLGDVEYSAEYVRRRLDQVADELLRRVEKPACLLSGGVDSMLAAYLTSRRRPAATSHTLGLSSKVEDVALAMRYAKAFGLEHHVEAITPEDVVEAVSESIWRSEIYHLYNVYCAVGMVLLGRRLAMNDQRWAMSGEGANEAFGDYHDWTITLRDGSQKTIQTTDIDAFNSSRGRHAYIWGNPGSEKQGFYNRQLGSGLAKHGVSRMYKPMYEYGVQLLSPFMDVRVLKPLASISADDLAKVGGKPGFMALVFKRDVKEGRIPEDFLLNRKKTRLQDANPHGQGGITEILLERGYGQREVVAIFNQMFHSKIADDQRFVKTELRT